RGQDQRIPDRREIDRAREGLDEVGEGQRLVNVAVYAGHENPAKRHDHHEEQDHRRDPEYRGADVEPPAADRQRRDGLRRSYAFGHFPLRTFRATSLWPWECPCPDVPPCSGSTSTSR